MFGAEVEVEKEEDGGGEEAQLHSLGEPVHPDGRHLLFNGIVDVFGELDVNVEAWHKGAPF